MFFDCVLSTRIIDSYQPYSARHNPEFIVLITLTRAGYPEICLIVAFLGCIQTLRRSNVHLEDCQHTSRMRTGRVMEAGTRVLGQTDSSLGF
jgi:hypothetical protein